MTKSEELKQLEDQLSNCRKNNDVAGFAATYELIEKVRES